MKLEQTKGVLDDHEDNFAIVFAAMGVRSSLVLSLSLSFFLYTLTLNFLPLQ